MLKLISACTSVVLLLSGCAGGGPGTETAAMQPGQPPAKGEAKTAPQRPAIVNINEPGDTSLTCPQLQTAVTSASDDMMETRARLQDTRAGQAASAGASAAMSQMPGGGMLAMFSAAQRGADMGLADNQMSAQDRMFRLEARRDNLTMMYNMKCSQAAKGPPGKKKS